MIDVTSDFVADYPVGAGAPHKQTDTVYSSERPVGVIMVAVALTLSLLANIAISFVQLNSLSNDGFLYTGSTSQAAHALLWADILWAVPVFVFIAGLFGEGAWARTALIGYLCCNLAVLSLSFFSTFSYQWISMVCDVAIIVYLSGDEVGALYPPRSGKFWGIACGLGLAGVQLLSVLLILHNAS